VTIQIEQRRCSLLDRALEAPQLAVLVASGSESLGTKATESRRWPAGRAIFRGLLL